MPKGNSAARYLCALIVCFASAIWVHAQPPVAENAPDAAAFCTAQKWTVVPGAVVGKWQPVSDARIEDPSYQDQIFESQAVYGGKRLFIYKVMMNIRGKPIYESVDASRTPLSSIRFCKGLCGAELTIRNSATEFVTKNGSPLERLIVNDTQSRISPWTFADRMFFTFEGRGGYLIVELKENGISTVCSHVPENPRW